MVSKVCTQLWISCISLKRCWRECPAAHIIASFASRIREATWSWLCRKKQGCTVTTTALYYVSIVCCWLMACFFFPSFYRHHHQSKESGGTVTAGKYSCCGSWRVLLLYILVDVCARILSLLLLEWVYTYLHIAIARLIWYSSGCYIDKLQHNCTRWHCHSLSDLPKPI